MVKVLKGVGWMLITLAVLSLVCIPLVLLFDDSGDKGDASLGFMVFAAFFGLPGGFLLWRGRELGRRQELAGYMRVYDRFTVEELAKKIGRTEAATEKMIHELAREERLDIVFHRPDRSYMHRSRLAAAASARVFDVCPSCGARLPHEVALEGERATCVYCGTVL